MEGVQASWQKLFDKLDSWLDAIISNLPNIVLAVIVIALSAFLARYIRKYAEKLFGRMTQRGAIKNILANIVTVIFMAIMFFIVLGILNLDTILTTVLAGAGVLGLAVGLALQDPIINLFSGIIMSVRDYYREGDLVETNGQFGTIQKIDLRSTFLLRPDGQEVVMPNKSVLEQPLINFSHNGRRRVDISCGVSYGDDLDEAKEVALNAITENVQTIKGRPIELFYNEFGDSSINFTLRYWVDNVGQTDFLRAQDEGIRAVKRAFDNAGITIPFPIRTLDFGIVGGERLDEMYPVDKIGQTQKNNNGQNQ